jgi:hypothetical protein
VTVARVSGRVPTSTGSGQPHSRRARWAVGLSLVSGVMILASIAIATICAAVGAETAGIGALLPPGAFGSLAAFVLAIVAKVRHEQRSLL